MLSRTLSRASDEMWIISPVSFMGLSPVADCRIIANLSIATVWFLPYGVLGVLLQQHTALCCLVRPLSKAAKKLSASFFDPAKVQSFLP